jgi:hypothetical protein
MPDLIDDGTWREVASPEKPRTAEDGKDIHVTVRI